MRKCTRKQKRIAMAVVISLVVAGLFIACGHRRSSMHDPERMEKFATYMVDDVLDDLDATDAQREDIHAIKSRVLAEITEMHADRKDHHAVILDEMKKDTPDADRLHARVDDKAEKMRAFAHRLVDYGVEVHQILDREQRAELVKKVNEHLEDCH